MHNVEDVNYFNEGTLDASFDIQSCRIEELTSAFQIIEIYLPNALWKKEAFNQFLEQLKKVCPNFTTFNNADGEWAGSVEKVRVIRMSVELPSEDNENASAKVRENIKKLCADLLVDLETKDDHRETLIFFNDWRASGNSIRRSSEFHSVSDPV